LIRDLSSKLKTSFSKREAVKEMHTKYPVA
jgi:hypothetical protein